MRADGSTAGVALELLRRAGAGAGADAGALSAVELYARAEVAETALAAERGESAKLRANVEHILGEIEARAPLMAQQRRDYDRALKSHAELSERLAAALRDAAAAAAAADQAREREARAQVRRGRGAR